MSRRSRSSRCRSRRRKITGAGEGGAAGVRVEGDNYRRRIIRSSRWPARQDIVGAAANYTLVHS